jgi:DNA ligase-associated metallophosphoesterase
MNEGFELCGQRLVPRADRSLYWADGRTLLVADPHFGKADTFRAFGVPVPGGAEEALARVAAAVSETQAERLVVLGDFWHAHAGRTGELAEQLARWKAGRPSLAVDLVRGNHDRAGPPPPGWGDWHAELHDPPFVFAHFPDPSPAGYTLAGHLHPGVLLYGRGRQRLKLPAFRFSERVGVLPAFGTFTGLSADVPRPGERVFALTEAQVVEVSVG